jgi:hypothetical protein
MAIIADTANTRIFAVDPNRTRIHAYRSVLQIRNDVENTWLGTAEFYDVLGRRLTRVLQANRLTLEEKGPGPGAPAVDGILDATVVNLRAEVNAAANLTPQQKTEANGRLDQLTGKTLAQQFDIMYVEPMGHPAASGTSAGSPLDKHITDQGGWLHNLLFH